MQKNRNKKRIIFPKGYTVKVDGIPFELESATVVKGNINNLKLINSHNSLDVPSVLDDAHDDTSDTIIPSSGSKN